MKICLAAVVCSTTLLIICYFFACTRANKNTVFVRSDVLKYVTGAERTTLVRNDVVCARQCSRFCHCVSWAFDKDTGTCYLHPTVDTGSGGAQAFVYTDTEAMCGADFLHVPGPTEQGGKGQCKQRIWRNFTWFNQDTFPLPRTPPRGWTMCLKATPLGQTRFTINLVANGTDRVLHFDARINYIFSKTVVLAMFRNGQWIDPGMDLQDPNPPFPFVQDQQFELKFMAISDSLIEIHVDGEYFANWTTLPYSVSNITSVQRKEDSLQVETLDLWCNCESPASGGHI